MTNFTRDGDEFQVTIEPDEHGFTGRECPDDECLGYFTVEFGTGPKGDELPCHCPYCGHEGGHDTFWTQAQIEYAQSIAIREVFSEVTSSLKALERKPQRGSLISLEIKVDSRPHPIAYYAEQELETVVVCELCSLRYAIFGVFGFCPDCGVHNSLQILEANFRVIEKMLELAEQTEEPIRRSLIENGLEDAVSSFDGFGRELCRLHAEAAVATEMAATISFQNLPRAAKKIAEAYQLDLTNVLETGVWRQTAVSFQRRHLLAHAMGVIDQAYVSQTGEDPARVGRRIEVSAVEVANLLKSLRKLSDWLFRELSR